MIDELLPDGVVAEEAFDDPDDAKLFPEEQEVIARAVEKRRREFTTVRACARAAMARIGQPPVPLLPGERGAPHWPAGVVGSMTHCLGYRAAAVGQSTEVQAIGIDSEPHEPLPDGVLSHVALPAEIAQLESFGNGLHWDRLLFCAKESTYKAWFPMTRRWLGFEDAEITIDPAGTFTTRLLVPGSRDNGRPLTGFEGRWLVRDGLVLTAITVRPDEWPTKRWSALRPN